MRCRFLAYLAFASVFASVSGAASVAAASTVVTKPGAVAPVAEDRIAFSTSEKRTVAFEQLRFDGSFGDVAWLVPVPPGANVDIGDPSFFGALDLSTAPAFTPAAALGCGNVTITSASPLDEIVPSKPYGVTIVAPAEVASTLSSHGYGVDDSLRGALDGVEKAGERVAIVEISARFASPVVRVVGPAGRPMPTEHLGNALARVRGWWLSDSRMRLKDGGTYPFAFASLRWDESGLSYTKQLDDTLLVSPDGAVVTFASNRGLIAPQLGISSFSQRYLGDDACIARALASANSTDVVVDGAPGPAELAAATFACGARDDLAVAMVGLSPGSTWITRFESLSPALPGALETDGAGFTPSTHEVVLGGCPRADPGPPPASQPTTPSTGDGEGGGKAAEAAADACAIGLDSCSSSSSSSNDGCGSSSSSHDSCGGDSSSSSDGCGGSSGSGDSCSSGPHGGGADDGCHIGIRPRRIRLSPIVLGMLAVATILRRKTRPAV